MKRAREYFLKSSFSKEKVKKTALLAGDASNRQYYRIITENRSYIICLYDDSELEKMSDFQDVQKIFQENNVLVPKIHDADLKKGYFILEDLNDVTLLKKMACIDKKSEELNFYKMAIDELLKIHSIDSGKYTHSFFQKSFDRDKLMKEVMFSLEHLISWLNELLFG